MRRTKQQVLKDLPPKVIQDFNCEMPELQGEAHAYIEHNFPISAATQARADEGKKTKGYQILQNLDLHRKVCNHPLFVRDNLPAELRNKLKPVATMKNKEAVCDTSGKLLGLIDILK